MLEAIHLQQLDKDSCIRRGSTDQELTETKRNLLFFSLAFPHVNSVIQIGAQMSHDVNEQSDMLYQLEAVYSESLLILNLTLAWNSLSPPYLSEP